jgi:MoaA/NifB/PqqE/SkfB family radical SAM enzyme
MKSKIGWQRLTNFFLYILGIAIILYLIQKIGLSNIINSIRTTNPNYLIILLGIIIGSSILRIYKIKILFGHFNPATLVEIFLFSRIGKEISMVGYFSPLVQKRMRNIKTARNLIFDRYLEIIATLALGLLAVIFLFIKQPGYLMLIFIGAISAPLVALLLALKLNISKGWLRFKLLSKLSDQIQLIQQLPRDLSYGCFGLVILSLVTTGLDFLLIKMIFQALGYAVDFSQVALTWNICGLVSCITFMSLGTTEYSSVLLYNKLFNIPEAVVASMIIIIKTLTLAGILVYFLFRLYLGSKSNLKDIMLMLTNRCNSRCLHCNIWNISPDELEDFPLERLDKIPCKLKNITLTGGEPFLYQNMETLIETLFIKKKVRRITICTNGLLPGRLQKTLQALHEKRPYLLPKLRIRLSYDAFEEANDTLRGIQNSVSFLKQSIEICRKYGIHDLGVTQTCSSLNIGDVKKISAYAKQEDLQYLFLLAHSSDEFYGKNNDSDYNTGEVLNPIHDLIHENLSGWQPKKWVRAYFIFNYITMLKEKRNRPFLHPCLAGEYYRFITASGEVKPCPFLEEGFGNIQNLSVKQLRFFEDDKLRNTVTNCRRFCWVNCTANQEIKSNLPLVLFWILKTRFLMLLKKTNIDFNTSVYPERRSNNVRQNN